jgi:hypothetical protein
MFTPQSRGGGSIEWMADPSDDQDRSTIEEILARLDDLTDRVERLEAASPRRTPGVSSLGVTEGDFEDEDVPGD